ARPHRGLAARDLRRLRALRHRPGPGPAGRRAEPRQHHPHRPPRPRRLGAGRRARARGGRRVRPRARPPLEPGRRAPGHRQPVDDRPPPSRGRPTMTEQRYGITVPFDGVPLHQQREWFEEAADLGYTDFWSSEADGTDGFTPLALAAAWTPTMRLGQAILPAYLRGPALLAQSAAALCEAAPGRVAIGVGTSSNVIVE